MKHVLFVGSVLLVLSLWAGCATTTVVFSEGTPPHQSINAALESNSLDMRLVSIIDAGSTDSYRGMTLTAYALSETEVTQADYETVRGSTGYFYLSGKGETHPEYSMSWYEAAEFCNNLSAMVGLEEVYDESTWEADFTRNGFYLPLEAQWEYAAGGPNHYRWSLGDTFNALDYGFDDTQARPVKSHPPNGFGLYDMTGSQTEWCHDWYGEEYPHAGVTDPSGPATGSHRVARGGLWNANDPRVMENDWRVDASEPWFSDHHLGFRVAAGGNGSWQ